MDHAKAGNKRGLSRSFGSAAILVLLICACNIHDSTGPDHDRNNPGGALDVILLSEKTDEAGPLFFDHRRHYAPRENGGVAIGCRTCHHDFTGSEGSLPQACSNCHFSHSDTRLGDPPSL